MLFPDEFLCFDIHCEAIQNSTGQALGGIISKFSSFRNIGFKTFDKLFASNAESVMSYGVSTRMDDHGHGHPFLVSSIGLKDFSFEQVQSRAARYFLGVHPKTPILALYGGLGWILFKYKRWLYMCRMWNRFL